MNEGKKKARVEGKDERRKRRRKGWRERDKEREVRSQKIKDVE